MLLYFSGIDGSGKSTHAKLLSLYFKRRGTSVTLTWMRWFAFFSYPLLAFCRILGLTRHTPNSPIPVRDYWRYRPIAVLWLHLYLFDYLIYILSELLFSGGTIVADRFALDIFVDVIYDTHLNPLRHIIGRFFLLFIYRLLRKGVIRGVVMIVDADTVFKRRNDVPSRSYVYFRIPMYAALANYLGIPVIDGREDLISNFRRILKVISVA